MEHKFDESKIPKLPRKITAQRKIEVQGHDGENGERIWWESEAADNLALIVERNKKEPPQKEKLNLIQLYKLQNK